MLNINNFSEMIQCCLMSPQENQNRCCRLCMLLAMQNLYLYCCFYAFLMLCNWLQYCNSVSNSVLGFNQYEFEVWETVLCLFVGVAEEQSNSQSASKDTYSGQPLAVKLAGILLYCVLSHHSMGVYVHAYMN